MKAIICEQYGSPDVLESKELAKPSPKGDELLVKVKAVALNPADWRRLRADPFFIRLENGLLTPKVAVLGADIAGKVEAVGENVTQFKPGDEVFGDISAGGFAEYACAPQDKFSHKPQNVSFVAAAATPFAGNTALQAIRDFGQVKAGQKVLINGASGGVGTFAVQIAKHYEASVTGVCSTRNIDLVRSLGADDVIDYTREDITLVDTRFDLILDLVGNRPASDFQAILAPNGICGLLGFTTIGHMLKFVIQGAWLARRENQKMGPMNATKSSKNLGMLGDMLATEQIKPVIDRCYRFHEVPDAMRYVETGRSRGKVVVELN